MAQSAVSFVLERLSNILNKEAILLQGVTEEVEWLRSELRWMDCFLIDAYAKTRRGNELVKNWLSEVRDVANRADDIIDAFLLEIEPRLHPRGLTDRIKRYLAFTSEVSARHQVGRQIEGLRTMIDQINDSRRRYGLVHSDAVRATGGAIIPAAYEAIEARRRIYAHHPDDDHTIVIGFDVHKRVISDQLLDPNVTRRCVVYIVGMGGLGKTTLANMVYNSSRVKEHFDACACFSVSQNYGGVQEIYKKIIQQMMGKSTSELQGRDIDELIVMLREFLAWRRYLIVLDDVWSRDVWEQLKRAALPDVNNGSRVLITTRRMDVATSIDPNIPPFQLPFLDDVDSWALFLRKAFPNVTQKGVSIGCPEELEEIGRRLVRRCSGLPLALVMIGGLLSTKHPDPREWTRVAEHMGWTSTHEGVDCLKILGLSYDNLPHHHLRSCFLYLGVFPEYWEIKASELMELWIGEGLIPICETQSVEDTAQNYLMELSQRSMIQVVGQLWSGHSASVQSFRIHDLFRDLCIREARDEGLFIVYSNNNNSSSSSSSSSSRQVSNWRRLVVHGDLTTEDVKDWCHSSTLRSILVFGTIDERCAKEIFNRSKLLRVIHFEKVNGTQRIPEENLMMHLRYLRFRRPAHITRIKIGIP